MPALASQDALTKAHKPGDLKPWELILSYSSGGQKSRIKVEAGFCALQGSEEKSLFASASFWWWPMMPGLPWL